jgi:hypothetical protein
MTKKLRVILVFCVTNRLLSKEEPNQESSFGEKMEIYTAQEFFDTFAHSYQRSGQVERLIDIANRFNLPLDRITIIENRDPHWNSRRNRTVNEKRAVRFGQSNGGLLSGPNSPTYINYVVWAFPTDNNK